MNASVCSVCSSAVCDCSNAVPVFDASASAVSVALKNCILCFEDKEEDAFTRYAFRCGCKDKEKYMCDECVGGWLKCGVNKNCPNCRHNNFAKIISALMPNFDFSFNVVLPDFVYDGSFNELSFSQKQIELKPYLRSVFHEFVRKNHEFYKNVYSRLGDDNLTKSLTAFTNLYNFLDKSILKDNFPNMEDESKFCRFFILDDEAETLNPEKIKTMKLHNFMSDDNDYSHLNNSYWVMVNTSYDRWEQFRFSFETSERIDELIDDNIAENIHFHDIDEIIPFLNTPRLRDAFNRDSHFWEIARENEMTDEILAMLDRNAYHDHIRDSFYFVREVFMNSEQGYFDILEFEDPNECYDYDDGDLYYVMEFAEAYNF